MKRLSLCFLMVMMASCVRPPIKDDVKNPPEVKMQAYKQELTVIIREYFELSRRNNVEFSNKVGFRFENIDRKNVLAMCSYGLLSRRISLDIHYWEEATWNAKISTVYHEMTHCYCGRAHDFDEGKDYPDTTFLSVLKQYFGKYIASPLKPEGFLDDNCPKSIMYPYSFSDQCFQTHYAYYVKEMFNRCDPW